MKILHLISQFFSLTGAELYVYELAREQVRRGHYVVVCAPMIGGELSRRARKAGVIVASPSTLEQAEPWDVLHIHHYHVIPEDFAPSVPRVATLHDLRDKTEGRGVVARWIVVREDQQVSLPEAVHIPNGFDLERFNPMPPVELVVPIVLAAGNFRDDRRAAMLEDLTARAEAGEILLYVVGNGLEMVHPSRQILRSPPAWDIERHLAHCAQTASLYVGRTAIEGFLCGRPGWVYDPQGERVLVEPPPDARERYGIGRVAEQVEEVYRSVG